MSNEDIQMTYYSTQEIHKTLAKQNEKINNIYSWIMTLNEKLDTLLGNPKSNGTTSLTKKYEEAKQAYNQQNNNNSSFNPTGWTQIEVPAHREGSGAERREAFKKFCRLTLKFVLIVEKKSLIHNKEKFQHQ
ncbi:MAG: hypothetical protein ACXABK_00645 [Candidatus Heimdallarchaeaceae archaeon]|jgi:hypothetical protein